MILSSLVSFEYRSTKFLNEEGREAERRVCTAFRSSRLPFPSIGGDEDGQLMEDFESQDGPNFHNEENLEFDLE